MVGEDASSARRGGREPLAEDRWHVAAASFDEEMRAAWRHRTCRSRSEEQWHVGRARVLLQRRAWRRRNTSRRLRVTTCCRSDDRLGRPIPIDWVVPYPFEETAVVDVQIDVRPRAPCAKRDRE